MKKLLLAPGFLAIGLGLAGSGILAGMARGEQKAGEFIEPVQFAKQEIGTGFFLGVDQGGLFRLEAAP